jgi:uncharacterized protein with von Willebrand factor type A (vWA) domain
MGEFGFLEHIYDHLPPEFTAVFEIARVLEDEDSALRKKLEPALHLPSIEPVATREAVEIFQHDIPSGEEYEADFIRNRRDVARIYSWQFLLPEKLFDQRLAERQLMLPVAKAPLILPVQNAGENFTFSSNKQKVFVLFDTSNSMRAHHRIHLAKALLFHFLDRNKEEMGFISLRTFDDKVGDMHTALDDESYGALIRYILRITELGSGTVLQKALLIALDEIATQEHLAGAEILVITDGAVSLDEELIRSRMDETTKIHTVKIGHAQVYASEKFIEELVLSGKAGHAKLINDLLLQEKDLKHQLQVVQAKDKHGQVERSLRSVEEQLRKKKKELGEEFQKAYGHELERLSSVYVEVDDLPENVLFRAGAEEIGDLELLIDSLEEDAEKFFTPEMTKKIAMMHDHVGLLLRYANDPELRRRLEALDERLRKLLQSALSEDGEADAPSVEEGSPSAPHSRVQIPLNEDDIRDLHFLLEFDNLGGRTQWKLLFRYIRKQIGKAAKTIFSARIRIKLPFDPRRRG